MRNLLSSNPVNPATAHPKAILRTYGLHPRRALGQNFLVNDAALHAIATRVALLRAAPPFATNFSGDANATCGGPQGFLDSRDAMDRVSATVGSTSKNRNSRPSEHGDILPCSAREDDRSGCDSSCHPQNVFSNVMNVGPTRRKSSEKAEFIDINEHFEGDFQRGWGKLGVPTKDLPEEPTQRPSLAAHAVLEWGPGLGALTRHLLEQDLRVYAVDVDERLLGLLRRRFAPFVEREILQLHHGDAQTFDVAGLVGGQEDLVLCGNLPYNIASRLLVRSVELAQYVRAAVYLVQKEVAQRVCASGGKAYGLLSVLVQVRFQTRLLRTVPAGAFWPVPKVDAAVVELIPRPRQEQPQLKWEKFKALVQTAFAQRRKKLKNALACLQVADEVFQRADIDPSLRAEQLTPTDFVRLHHALKEEA